MRALSSTFWSLAVLGAAILLFPVTLESWSGLPAETFLPIGGALLVVGIFGVVAMLVAAEGAFSALRRTRAGQMQEADGRPATNIPGIHDQLVDLTAVTRASETLAVVIGTFILTSFLRPVVEPILGQVAGAVAVILAVMFVATVGVDYVAHAAGVRNAERYAVALAGLADLALRVGRPVLWTLRGLGHLVSGAPVGHTRLTAAPVSEDGIMRQVDVAEEEGVLEEDEGEMIRSIIDLGNTIAREVMSHRIDVVGIPGTTSVAEAVARGLEAGHSRIPIYDGSIDGITGIFYLRDALARHIDAQTQVSLLARPAYFVPETKKVDDLLREMQSRRVHLAVVVDEYGGTAGVVSIEDIIEEIVGDIQDEFDRDDVPMHTLDDGSIVVDAAMTLDDLNDALDLSFESDEVDSVGGLVYLGLGRVPSVGDFVTNAGATIAVEEIDGNRIVRVRITRTPNDGTPVQNRAATEVAPTREPSQGTSHNA
ncbi:MAG: hemolysin family protein [Chloroflexota bacterium]|nr:hemolysin family protein [Chloroflexota bacterium]